MPRKSEPPPEGFCESCKVFWPDPHKPECPVGTWNKLPTKKIPKVKPPAAVRPEDLHPVEYAVELGNKPLPTLTVYEDAVLVLLRFWDEALGRNVVVNLKRRG